MPADWRVGCIGIGWKQGNVTDHIVKANITLLGSYGRIAGDFELLLRPKRSIEFDPLAWLMKNLIYLSN